MALQLDRLTLTHFKNYEAQELTFSPRVNAFVGLNGMGKTNLLDAIYYLCMTKSNFGAPDSAVAQHGADFFRLDGHFTRHDRTERIVAKVQPRKKKVIERNRVPYDKLSEHIGLLPVVFITPDDTLLVTEGSDIRRRFLDNTLSQIDAHYLQQLIVYNRLLKQRNALLKQWGERGGYDRSLLQVYDQQMLEPAAYIFAQRSAFAKKMIPLFQAMHQQISGGHETVELQYQSQLQKQPLDQWWEEHAEKDRILQRTTAGIHKDDIRFTIHDYALKRYASQGQLKSYVLALKLAQFRLLHTDPTLPPLLLLDDIFDKLDTRRVTQLLALLVQGQFGQIFITDTHQDRTAAIVRELDAPFQRFLVHEGTASPG